MTIQHQSQRQSNGPGTHIAVRVFGFIISLAGAVAIVVGSDANTSGALAFPFVLCLLGMGMSIAKWLSTNWR